MQRELHRRNRRHAGLEPGRDHDPADGPARGFELDLYDGDLFLIGDLARMVVARKVSDSEAAVVQNTVDIDYESA